MLGMYWFTQVSFVANIKIHLVRLLSEDGDEARPEDGSIWGQTKLEIMQRCRRKHTLLPSSIFCKGVGNRVWTNMFRVEEEFEIKTGKR